LPAIESEELNESTPVEKKMLAAKKRNEVAITNFTMAFTMEGVMGWSTRHRQLIGRVDWRRL
jgi:hypothetical protein